MTDGQAPAQHSWTVAEQFTWTASRHHAEVALIDQVRVLTYGELWSRVASLATFLQERVGAGQRIGLYLANRAEWAEVFLACQFVGVVPVPINDRYREREVNHILEAADVALVVTDRGDHRGDVIAGLQGDVSVLDVGDDYERALRTTRGGAPPRPTDEQDSAILFTSGTTSMPRGVRITQANQALGSFLGPATLMGLTSSDRILIATPLGHRVGQVRLLGGLLTGATTVLSADARPATLVASIAEHGITVTGMVPTIARDLAQSGEVGDRLDSLRALSVTGEPMTQDMRTRVAEMLPSTLLWTFFASTETGLASALPPELFTERPTSSGRALPGVELAILPLGAETSSDEGEGEILVRSGPPGSYAVAAGYLDSRPSAPFVDTDGWFHTGDLGLLEDGWLTVTGRRKDMILSGGFNIAAAEVEAVLQAAPDVREVAVTGEPDDRFGERIVAWVVADEPTEATAEAIRTFAKEHAAGYKAPRIVRFVPALPRTASGKLAKWRLAEIVDGEAQP